MEINLTPAHNTNQNECLLFPAEIPNKHSFLIRCNRKRPGGETSFKCPDLPQLPCRLFMLRTWP